VPHVTASIIQNKHRCCIALLSIKSDVYNYGCGYLVEYMSSCRNNKNGALAGSLTDDRIAYDKCGHMRAGC
jgi:hypothetical protein